MNLSGLSSSPDLTFSAPATMWSDKGTRSGAHWVMDPDKGEGQLTVHANGAISLGFNGQKLFTYESYSDLMRYFDGSQYHTSDPGRFWGHSPSVMFDDMGAVHQWFDMLLESGSLSGMNPLLLAASVPLGVPGVPFMGLGDAAPLKCPRGEVPVCTPRYKVPGLSGVEQDERKEKKRRQLACGRSPEGHKWVFTDNWASGKRHRDGTQIIHQRYYCQKCGKHEIRAQSADTGRWYVVRR